MEKTSMTATPKQILVVDAEPHIMNLIRLSLKNDQFQVAGVYSAREAMEYVKTATPDVIVLDIMMPGMNGYELCKMLRAHPGTKETPIIILSAKSQMDDKLQAIDVGADDYLTKPFDPMELLKRIKVNLDLAG